jgi:hypothetical protein
MIKDTIEHFESSCWAGAFYVAPLLASSHHCWMRTPIA